MGATKVSVTKDIVFEGMRVCKGRDWPSLYDRQNVVNGVEVPGRITHYGSSWAAVKWDGGENEYSYQIDPRLDLYLWEDSPTRPAETPAEDIKVGDVVYGHWGGAYYFEEEKAEIGKLYIVKQVDNSYHNMDMYGEAPGTQGRVAIMLEGGRYWVSAKGFTKTPPSKQVSKEDSYKMEQLSTVMGINSGDVLQCIWPEEDTLMKEKLHKWVGYTVEYVNSLVNLVKFVGISTSIKIACFRVLKRAPRKVEELREGTQRVVTASGEKDIKVIVSDGKANWLGSAPPEGYSVTVISVSPEMERAGVYIGQEVLIRKTSTDGSALFFYFDEWKVYRWYSYHFVPSSHLAGGYGKAGAEKKTREKDSSISQTIKSTVYVGSIHKVHSPVSKIRRKEESRGCAISIRRRAPHTYRAHSGD